MAGHRRPLRICVSILYAVAAASCLAAMLAACGGGGTSSILRPPIKPALAEATTIPFASAGTPMPLPTLGGFTETITLPTNSEQQFPNLLNVLVSNTEPSGMPAPSIIVRRSVEAAAGRRLHARRDGLSPA